MRAKRGLTSTLIDVQNDLINNAKNAINSINLVKYSMNVLRNEMIDNKECTMKINKELESLEFAYRRINDELYQTILCANKSIFQYEIWNPVEND